MQKPAWFARPSKVGIALVPTVVVAYLVAVPLVVVVALSLGVGRIGAGDGALGNYRTLITTPTLLQSVWNTVVFAGLASLGTVIIGSWLAWVAERTTPRWRYSIRVLVLLPAVMPGILTTVAWVMVLSERIGLANQALARLGASAPIFDAYTLPAMIWVEATDGLALPFLIVTAAIRQLDPDALHASSLAGASPRQTMRMVTLPILLPALVASLLIVIVRTAGSFAVPAAMGIPGGIRVLATEVYLLARRYPPQVGLASAYAVVQLALTALALVGYRVMTVRADRYRSTGERRLDRQTAAGARPIELAIAVLVLVVTTLVPLVVSLLVAMMPRTGSVTFSFGAMTLDHFRLVLESPVVRRGIKNSIIIGGGAAVATTLLALSTALASLRTSRPLARALDLLATAPVAIPGNVLGLALLYWYLLLPDVGLYASSWVIGIAFITAFLPYAHRAVHAALLSSDPTLEAAAATSGAGPLRVLLTITVPVITPGIIAGLLLVGVRTVKSVALPALLAGPGTEVLPLLVYERYEAARYAEASAIGLLASLLAAAALGLAAVLHRRVERARRSSGELQTMMVQT